MKSIVRITVCLSAVIIGACTKSVPDAASAGWPRMIKLSFRDRSGFIRIRINQSRDERIADAEFTNRMAKLNLSYGDIVVWQPARDRDGKEFRHASHLLTWWNNYIQASDASFYLYNACSVDELLATRMCHWKGPSEKPRPLEDAVFFVDGLRLGQGTSGFRAMVESISRQKRGPVFILAPRLNGGDRSWIADDQLVDWAKAARLNPEFDEIRDTRYVGLFDLDWILNGK